MAIIRVSLIALILLLGGNAFGSNCCVPAVPQQGVMGETVTQPHTLDIGLHYEYLRAEGEYHGSESVADPDNTRAVWKRMTLTLGYGLFPGFGLSAIIPYVSKAKTWDDAAMGELHNSAEGLGDITVMVRYSPLARSFVDFRELSIGLGIKAPSGSTEKKIYGAPLPLMLQPGTGSWDYLASLSYYRGFERVDLFASASYVFTGDYDGYEFGDQTSYLFSSNYHLSDRVDLSAALTGAVRSEDTIDGVTQASSGRHEAWLVPSVTLAVIPGSLRLQTFWEQPVYHNLDGSGQLGSDYNIRLSATYSLPLAGSDGDD